MGNSRFSEQIRDLIMFQKSYKEKEAKEKNEIENLKNKVSVLLLQLKVPDNVIKDCKKILDYKGYIVKKDIILLSQMVKLRA